MGLIKAREKFSMLLCLLAAIVVVATIAALPRRSSAEPIGLTLTPSSSTAPADNNSTITFTVQVIGPYSYSQAIHFYIKSSGSGNTLSTEGLDLYPYTSGTFTLKSSVAEKKIVSVSSVKDQDQYTSEVTFTPVAASEPTSPAAQPTPQEQAAPVAPTANQPVIGTNKEKVPSADKTKQSSSSSASISTPLLVVSAVVLAGAIGAGVWFLSKRHFFLRTVSKKKKTKKKK